MTALGRDAVARRRCAILGHDMVALQIRIELCRNAVAVCHTRGLGHRADDVHGRNTLNLGKGHREIRLLGSCIHQYDGAAAAPRGGGRGLHLVALNVNRFSLRQIRGSRFLIVVQHHIDALAVARPKLHDGMAGGILVDLGDTAGDTDTAVADPALSRHRIRAVVLIKLFRRRLIHRGEDGDASTG
jgi:hypothetical protein